MSSSMFGGFNFTLDDSQIPQMSQTSQPLNVELPDLLKHPCVMELYRQNQALQSSQIKLQENQSKLAEFAEKSFALQDKNLALQNQLHSLESELTAEKLKVNALSTELQSLRVNINL
jgi:hypothetical protein